jgi:hypothetical protein
VWHAGSGNADTFTKSVANLVAIAESDADSNGYCHGDRYAAERNTDTGTRGNACVEPIDSVTSGHG